MIPNVQSAKPVGNEIENVHLINNCNDFMIAMNKPMRTMAKRTNMDAPNA